MGLQENLLKFIASKWFVLALGIALIGVAPFTYYNLQVVLAANQLGSFWYIAVVFGINMLSIMMCVYKFMSLVSKPKNIQQEDW